ncbi:MULTISPECIES: ATP-binding protein [unclassified Campylobacter]|uniref:ATP-binding protein n=1 Tax=unclassified Campylobacter TaxID=2593542 RepID=UPI0012380B3C|nr:MULTISPECIES: ATP-binding protein [unclassified Campylobacter]KAA6225149.1 ATP-binding protein [Campylobacter sp. LR196d]KAA6226163.1 ATP-binding protein [Campylobacter sp. LR185c]KAA6228111.1 ATP-binding protein [Campylobacter sp. LR286c]KAA6231364.1 ATP-binding protein [Campylobacter sp. LR264d]KAA6231575.1 ATP-binding protein [Campylobacter sp. LR291e]
MQVDASNNQNFYTTYTTKSGNTISLSMYDNQSVNYLQDESGQSLSLRREYGFNFSYEGSKLSQEDLDEIKEAMKDVEPLLQEFLDNSKVSELNPQDLITSAMQIADILPGTSDENTQNVAMDKLVSTLDNLLNKNKTENASTNLKMLEDSKNLLEEVLKKMQEKLRENLEKSQEALLKNNDDSNVNLLV